MAKYEVASGSRSGLPPTKYRSEQGTITLIQAIPEQDGRITISAESLLPEMAEHCLSEDTISSKRSHLRAFMEFLMETDLQLLTGLSCRGRRRSRDHRLGDRRVRPYGHMEHPHIR